MGWWKHLDTWTDANHAGDSGAVYLLSCGDWGDVFPRTEDAEEKSQIQTLAPVPQLNEEAAAVDQWLVQIITD